MTSKNVEVDDDNLPIQQFKLENMVDSPSILMIAKRGSGKSYVCRALISHFKKLPGGVVISQTDRMNGFYKKHAGVPDSYIHNEYKTEIAERILYRQKRMIQKAKEKAKEGKKVDPSIFLIMDDCMSDNRAWSKDKPIKTILFEGRHYKITYILTLQDPMGIPPDLRGNIDYVFLLADDKVNNQKKLYDHYAGIFNTFDQFRQVFMDLTEDYGCMVVDNRRPCRSILDKIYWFKAKDKDVDKIGTGQYRDIHYDNYDNKWEEHELKMDANTYLDEKKKNKTRINIKKVRS